MDEPDPASDHDRELAQLNQLLLSTESFDGFLGELVAYAAEETNHACGITVRTKDNRTYTVASSDARTSQLDEYQYGDNTGPCLEALRTGVPVFVTDMATETRWQPYPQQAAALGARSSLSYPLINAEQILGALNLYAFQPLANDAGLQSRAAQLAERAAGALAVALRLAQHANEAANLRQALTSRSIIDQAMGIIMGEQRCAAEQAFDLIRRSSQNRNVKVRDVAAQIVAGVARSLPEEAG
jgi:GAF domain-containing protein